MAHHVVSDAAPPYLSGALTLSANNTRYSSKLTFPKMKNNPHNTLFGIGVPRMRMRNALTDDELRLVESAFELCLSMVAEIAE